MLGILALVAFVAIIALLTSLKDKLVGSVIGAANRRVQPTKHAAGVELVTNTFFYAIDAPNERIIQALTSGVKARSTAPALGLGETFIEGHDDNTVTWAHGTKLSTSFRAVAAVVTTELEGGGEQRGIVLGFPESSVADGLTADMSAMRALKHDVLTSLRTLYPDVEEVVVP